MCLLGRLSGPQQFRASLLQLRSALPVPVGLCRQQLQGLGLLLDLQRMQGNGLCH